MEMPTWYHEMQVESAKDRIVQQLAQRAELVRWMAQIDADVEAANLELAKHEAALGTAS